VSPPKRSLARQTLHTFSTLIVGQGAQIVAGIVLARAFGPVGKGVVSYAGILIMFAVVTASGLKSAIAYQMGPQHRPAPEVYGSSLKLIAVAGAAGACLFLVLSRLQPSQPAFIAVACAFPFALFLHTVSGFYQLANRVERVNMQIMLTVGGGGMLLTAALILAFHVSLAVVLGAWVATFVVGAFANAWGAGEMIGGRPRLRGEGELLATQVRFGGKAALSGVIALLAQRIDVLIVSAALAPATLGVYTLALAVGETLWHISRALSWSAFRRIATRPREESVALTARVVRTLMFVEALVAAVLFVAGPWLISLVYGGRFAEAGSVLRLLLPGFVLYSADETLASFLTVREGRPAFVLRVELLHFAVCALVTLATIGRFGMFGAAGATTIAYIAAYLIKAVAFARATGTPLAGLFILRLDDMPLRLRTLIGRRSVAGSAGDP
jgi:O-antigen/teichoic acid export membrane protein